MNEREKSKLLSKYDEWCYSHRLGSDVFDIQAEIDSEISLEENWNIIEEKLNLMVANETKIEEAREKSKFMDITEEEITHTEWIKKRTNDSVMFVIVGKRGSGKTALGFHVLELHKMFSKRPIFIYKFPKPSLLPEWVKNTNNADNVPDGAVLLMDEASTKFDQFSFNKERTQRMVDLIKTARHKELSLIFITQNGNMLTRDVRRLIDCYLLREPSLVQKYDETGIIRKLYVACATHFDKNTAKMKGYYVADSLFEGFASFDLPDFWSEEISHAYNGQEEVFNSSSLIRKWRATKGIV